ncbi:DUF485 domain-containing protein [Paraburkholderia madseniana]|jgi:uncharacterized membrane protein (DUF485 family)|uniref:DUF485 domain-containing protein n=1 Tax=Paraburkholderia madseniana TaxID=2599607 RepID=A0AAP5BHS4_9BURK|nr:MULTISPECIES: DUF485 domain-containing protein [Paraburkholderia]MCX4149179.1 DUF485 domain-containing protein [Paraburkholderia madseniana]MDN7152116.1 DUF485 domain-containing protein [Paraburkholderia sp. WS6]MDQ6410996.1 DUF485 domain-containing protein [Paraburkholderia madseniana]
MSGTTMEVDGVGTGRERVGLAIFLTLVEVLMFFGFITLAAVSPATLASPVVDGSRITVAFLYGIVILIAGVLLIGLYVLVENAADSRDFVSIQPKVIR